MKNILSGSQNLAFDSTSPTRPHVPHGESGEHRLDEQQMPHELRESGPVTHVVAPELMSSMRQDHSSIYRSYFSGLEVRVSWLSWSCSCPDFLFLGRRSVQLV